MQMGLGERVREKQLFISFFDKVKDKQHKKNEEKGGITKVEKINDKTKSTSIKY